MKMDTKMIAILVLIVLLVGAVAFLISTPTNTPTDRVISTQGNVIEGKITNVKVSPGTLEGISAYDRNCVGQPITECDGGIETEKYGLLNFHYSHDMSKVPCIHMHGPEKLTIEIIDSDGTAKVYRHM